MMPTGHKSTTAAIVEQINRRHSSTEVVRVEEKVPQSIADRLEALEEKCLAFASFGAAFDQLSKRIAALESKPHVLPANDRVAVPAAFGEQVQKLDDLEQRFSDVEEALAVLSQHMGGDNVSLSVTEEGSTELAHEITDLTATVMRMMGLLQNEIEELRRRQNKSDSEQLELIQGMRSVTSAFAKQSA